MTARSATLGPNIRLGLLAAVPATTAAATLLMLAALNGGGEIHAGPVPLMSMAAGYARPAERLLAGTPTPARAADAERLTRKALAQFPYDPSGWMRLAYAETLQAGTVTPEAISALRRSYELSNADYYAGIWRIGFILENSQAIPRDLRMAARDEYALLWRIPRRRQELRQLPSAIRNPAGRLSAALWLNRAKSSAAK